MFHRCFFRYGIQICTCDIHILKGILGFAFNLFFDSPGHFRKNRLLKHIFIDEAAAFSKTVVQHGNRILDTGFGIRLSHDNSDHFNPVFFSRCRKAELCLTGGAGLQSCRVFVLANQFIGVGETEFAGSFSSRVGDIFHPDHRILMNLWIFCDEFPRHQCDISCGREVSVRIQSVAVYEMSMFHSKPLGTFVHLLYKGLLTATDQFGHCHTGVVRTCHRNAFDHSFHALLFSRFQKHLGSAHGCRILGSRHLILQMDLSTLKSIKNEQKCHDLGHTRRRKLLVGLLLIENFPGGSFHNYS